MRRVDVAVAFLALGHLAYAVRIDMRPGAEDCFFEELRIGDNVSFEFAVVHGSHRDVDFALTLPSGVQKFAVTREGEAQYNFTADNEGSHWFCFSNKMSIMAHKLVHFAIQIEEKGDDGEGLALREHSDRLEAKLLELNKVVKRVEFKQLAHRQLHDRHFNSVAETRSTVLTWALLQTACAIALAIIYLSYFHVLLTRRSARPKAFV